MVWISVLITVGSAICYTGRGAQLSCGQTNECLSIIGSVRLESRLLSKTWQRQFEAITDGRRWRVRFPDADRPTNSPPFWQEYGCDGQSVYAVTLYDTNYTGPRLFADKDGISVRNFSGRKPRNNATAKVIPGSIPMPNWLIEYVWLAYLSGCELTQLEAHSVSVLPALYGGGNETHHLTFKEPARWVLSRDFPYNPSRLEFFGGGMYSFSAKLGEHRTIPSQPFTNLALVVESTTNSGAWTVPARFSVIAFRPLPSAGSGAAAVSFTGRGETIAITRVPPPNSFLPAVPSSTSVEDWRLNVEEFTSYYASNRWFGPEEVKSRGRQ
jgi:hypothetical protein